MKSMTFELPDGFGEWIQSQIGTGRYATADDYVRDLIRRDQAAASDRDLWLADLDASIARGVADSDAGRIFDADAVFDELEAKYSALVVAAEGR